MVAPPWSLYWIFSIPPATPPGVSERKEHFQPMFLTRWCAMWPNWAGKFWWTYKTCIAAGNIAEANAGGNLLTDNCLARLKPAVRAKQ